MRRALGVVVAAMAAVAIGGVLFLAAGRSDLLALRVYALLWGVFLIASAVTSDPDLVHERVRPGPGPRESLLVAAERARARRAGRPHAVRGARLVRGLAGLRRIHPPRALPTSTGSVVSPCPSKSSASITSTSRCAICFARKPSTTAH